MKQGPMAAVAQQLKLESEYFGGRLATPEAKEAFGAFLEKRKPSFPKFHCMPGQARVAEDEVQR